MKPMVLVLSATALIAASSQPIRADPIRVNDVSAVSASSNSPSMVVGISGQLVALDVFLNRWASESAADGRAQGAVSSGDAASMLASRTITPFGMPPGLARMPVHFDLASAQLQVLAGRLLGMVQGNPAAELGLNLPGPPMHAANPPSPAAAGGSGGGSPLAVAAFSPADPTPEPTTIALVGSGLLLGAMGRRRQRRRQAASEK